MSQNQAKYSPATKSFLALVRKTCKKHGVELRLENSSEVFFEDEKMGCSGYFYGGKNPYLAVAIGKPEEEWLQTLLHEFNHVLQWAEGAKAYTGLVKGKKDYIYELTRWLEGEKELSPGALDKCIEVAIELESDCEKRSFKMMRELNLPIDHEAYSQKANAYVLFYHVIRKHRKWYASGSAPYSLQAAWESMPKTVDIDHHKITRQQMSALKLCLTPSAPKSARVAELEKLLAGACAALEEVSKSATMGIARTTDPLDKALFAVLSSDAIIALLRAKKIIRG